MSTVTKRCPKCQKPFRVLEDEQFDHDCPHGCFENMTDQPEHNGTDYFDNEILVDDEIVVDKEAGEVVLKENLDRYLEEVYGFQFTQAE